MSGQRAGFASDNATYLTLGYLRSLLSWVKEVKPGPAHLQALRYQTEEVLRFLLAHGVFSGEGKPIDIQDEEFLRRLDQFLVRLSIWVLVEPLDRWTLLQLHSQVIRTLDFLADLGFFRKDRPTSGAVYPYGAFIKNEKGLIEICYSPAPDSVPLRAVAFRSNTPPRTLWNEQPGRVLDVQYWEGKSVVHIRFQVGAKEHELEFSVSPKYDFGNPQ